jgi:uncharacterized small protein (DUF1192 family)
LTLSIRTSILSGWRRQNAREEDMFEDLDGPNGPAPATAIIGEDLSRHSVEELEARLTALRAEIARTEAEISTRGGVRAAADALFRK